MTLFEAEDARPAAPSGPLVRVRMTVAYDGRGFHGFAAQPGVRTVGGTLTDAIERVLRQPVELTCAGRTDTGVHARGQVVSFDAEAERFDGVGLGRGLNSMLAPAIVVRDVAAVAPDFDARRSAVARRYRYTVLNRAEPDPFLAPTSWWVEEALDLRAMQLACDPIIGEHDFASFCRVPRGALAPSTTRRVTDARWTGAADGVLRFDIEATSFCHQMVRSLVGTMVAMGAGRRRAGEMAAILRARSRAVAGNLAPPHGLCLWEVVYPPA